MYCASISHIESYCVPCAGFLKDFFIFKTNCKQLLPAQNTLFCIFQLCSVNISTVLHISYALDSITPILYLK